MMSSLLRIPKKMYPLKKLIVGKCIWKSQIYKMKIFANITNTLKTYSQTNS